MRSATPEGFSRSARGSLTAARNCAGSLEARSARASLIMDVTGMWLQPASSSRHRRGIPARRIMPYVTFIYYRLTIIFKCHNMCAAAGTREIFMSHAMTHARSAAAPGRDLHGRIGWICHGVRIAALVWIAWIVVMVVIAWSDKATILEAYGRLLGIDVTGVSTARYAVAFAIALVDLALVGIIVACIWRLFGTYLAGRVFTIDAALWLRRTGAMIIAAVAFDLVARVVTASLFAERLVLMGARGPLVLPQDLLHLIFALFLLALAHIFKAAAEMADDHAQIV